MSNFHYTDDTATIERLSEQRDAIYEGVVDQFRVLMAQDNIDGALALADEFFEWMDPRTYINESTHFYLEDDLREVYRRAAEDA